MRNILNKIKKFFRAVWRFLTPHKRRIYEVLSSSTPSMVGTRFVSTPKAGREVNLIAKEGYLTLIPLAKIKQKDKTIEVYGKYSRIVAKRIK